MLAGNEVAGGLAAVAKGAVALVEAGVEVAEGLAGEGERFALEAIGADVTADGKRHDRGFSWPGWLPAPPPQGGWVTCF